MAETSEYIMEDLPSSQSLHTRQEPTEKKLHHQHENHLQKLIQQTSLQSQKTPTWSHSVVTGTPQNLFLEGFKDCASEVLRFLSEEENVDDNNPLLIGLQAHLMKVSKTICPETITDLDRHDSDVEEKKYHNIMSSGIDNVHKDYKTINPQILPRSPFVPRSVINSLSSDTSVTETDISMSISSVSEKSRESSSSDVNSSFHSAVVGAIEDSFFDSTKSDDVFNSSSSHLDTSSSSVLPLRFLSYNALKKADIYKERPEMIHYLLSKEIPSPTAGLDVWKYSSSSSAFPVHHLQPSAHSSPIPKSLAQTSSLPANSCGLPQCLCLMPASPSNIPNFSTWNDSVVTNIDLSAPSSILPQQLLQIGSQDINQRSSEHYTPLSFENNAEFLRESDLLLQMSSIGSFLPGFDTTSVDSGNFADILLAVESCRFHDDSRVRALAEELVRLIHNEELSDNGDEFDYNDTDEEEENIYNMNEENGGESGIEMLDESADWGNAVDMIEQ